MALKAGYYGVKKQILDELDKLDGILPADVSKDNPLATQKEINDIWSSQAVLGAKNVFDYSVGNSTTTTTYTATNNGKNINIASITNGTYRGITLNFNVNKNTDYRLSTNVTITSGRAGIKIQQTDSTAIKTESIASSGEKTFTFNSGNNELLQMVLFCTWSTNEAGDVDYDDLIIQLASDTDTTYQPYAMTNKALTDNVVTLNGSASDQKTAINAIITAATGAADFAAFKAAMGAITPVTRSISVPADTREIEEPEVKTTKRSTKKTTTTE